MGGLRAKEAMDSGKLVADDIVFGIINDRIKNDDCKRGFILDGFPRTVEQAEKLDTMLEETGDKVTSLIELHVPDEVLTERICGRWIHKKSGRSYNATVASQRPKSLVGDATPTVENMLDDKTGEPLMQRTDDTLEALPKRLEEYHSETEPILKRYRDVAHRVNGDQASSAVWRDLQRVLPKLSPSAIKDRMKHDDCK